MTHELHVLSPTEQEITLIFAHEAYQSELDRRYREAQAAVQFKGFRRGKAPIDLIRRTMGKDIESDTVETLTQKHFPELAESLNLKMIGRARIRYYEFQPDLTLKIFVQYEVQPEFELKPFEGYEFTVPVFSVTEKAIDNELRSLLQEHAVWVNIDEPAGDDALLVADAQKLDEGGVPIIGGRFENQEFNLSKISDDAPLKKALLGAKAGEERTVDLELTEDGGQRKLTKLRLSIKEVKRQDFPTLTDDLAKEISMGRFETASSLTQSVREQLQEFYKSQADEVVLEDIAQKFISDNSIDLPESLVRSFSDSFVENAKQRLGGKFPPGFSEDAFRRQTRPSAENQAKWMLIRTKLIELGELKLEDADLKAEAEKDAARYGVDTETLMKSYQNEQMLNMIIDRVMRKKVYDYLKTKVTMREETHDFDAYMKKKEMATA